MKTAYLIVTPLLVISLFACKKESNTPEPEPIPAMSYAPKNLYVGPTSSGLTFKWESYNIQDPANFYQVEYGIAGFDLGSGNQQTVSTNSTSQIALAAGNPYQFYVRAYYDEIPGYSEWTGPFSYFASQNWHMCIAPSNVQFTIETNSFGQPVGANFTWDRNGEALFDYLIVANNASPNNANFSSIGLSGTPTFFLTQNTEYDFYVRAECIDGSKTNWVGPKNVNIGG